MNTLLVTSLWAGDGLSKKTAFVPQVCVDHPLLPGETWANTNGSCCGEGIAVVQFVVGPETEQAIREDTRYTVEPE